MLADHQIRRCVEDGHIGLDPYDPAQIQPASYDLTLSQIYRRPDPSYAFVIDCREVTPGHTLLYDAKGDAISLAPRDFVLASTIEKVTVPSMLAARVEGKSSLGRIGLAVHITAGFIDPGFEGPITLEIANLSPWEIWLWPRQRIAQIAFMPMSAEPEAPYGQVGHYQHQSGPTESRFRI